MEQAGGKYFVLNATAEEIYGPVTSDEKYFNLHTGAGALSTKQIIMLDEHNRNTALAGDIKADNKTYFDYQVWQTDHPFTN